MITQTATGSPQGTERSSLDEVIAGACSRIAPTWPLDRFIAVNPLWGWTDRSLPEAAARLRALSGSRLLMPRAFYREARREGRLRDEHLRAAIAQSESETTVEQLLALLESDERVNPRRARVMDTLDARRDLVREVSWRDFVTNSVSQFCASHFDEGQAAFGPPRDGGFYASWRRHARVDRSPSLLVGLDAYRDLARDLPETARETVDRGLLDLGVPAEEHEAYLTGLLLDLNGWASWCAYRRWTARLAGRDDDAIVDLLAIRVAWEWVLHQASGEALAQRWRLAMAAWPRVDALTREAQAEDWLLQRALELGWQEQLTHGFRPAPATRRPEQAAVQAVFCIDVRSEVFRRALEAQTEAIQTLGFAGFFGLPIEYQPLGSAGARPQLPGLLAPRLRVTDTGLAGQDAARRTRSIEVAAAWRRFKSGAVSTFAFVEAMGLAHGAQLLADSLGRSPRSTPDDAGLSREQTARRKPRLTGSTGSEEISPEARADLAAGMLRAMSLTHGFARLVLLAGHGSETRNNPHAAGLDCGACCGQTGEINARAAAALLNEPAVRAGLAARGIDVPETTHFLAGLHHTTTDEVTLFDLDEVPRGHATDVVQLRAWLVEAGARARQERAERLGLAAKDREGLREAIQGRARDWAQVRAEWGLAGNAAFIAAPRERCRHLDLAGRAFLHEYRSEEDANFSVLELIMTAPMVVAHWINFQYYASTVDQARYGSGNKVLHNVVGGHIGVFEGNGGDLRIGLPLQSLHDGQRWVHEPLRLSVFLDAPREAIEAILGRQEKVRSLVAHGWLDLFQIDASGAVHACRGEPGAWRWEPAPGPARG